MRYDRTAVVLHWVIGLALLGQFALGHWMHDLPKDPEGVRAWWFSVHRSIGIVLGALVVVRLLWRMSHPVATLVVPAWQRLAAWAAHYGLYACMLALPLSGFLGWLFPRSVMHEVHETVGWIFAALVTLHVAAALWHLARRDGVFARIWVFR